MALSDSVALTCLADLPLLPWLVKPLGMLFRGDTAEMEADEEAAAELAPRPELPQPPVVPNEAHG